jgi:GT2 family glycosyltransferase
LVTIFFMPLPMPLSFLLTTQPPYTCFLDKENLSRQIIELVREKKLSRALSYALFMTRRYPGLSEAHALAAHVFFKLGEPASSLACWKKALKRDPFNSTYTLKALQCAQSLDDSGFIAKTLSAFGSHFTVPPSKNILCFAASLKLPLSGSIGVHTNKLVGWIFTPEKERPSVTFTGAGSLRLEMTKILADQGFVLYRLKAPLPATGASTIRICDHTGSDLPGSPLFCQPPDHIFHGQKKPAPPTARSQQSKHTNKAKVTVLVPVFDDLKATLACLDALEKSASACRSRFSTLVVWDNGPDPALLEALQKRQQQGRITLISTAANGGFVHAVNTGLAACLHNDVVLLNADALVHGNWLDRLKAHAQRSAQTGTITPMTNYGELLSFPHPLDPGRLDSFEDVKRLDNACRQAAQEIADLPDIPVGIGFCLYIKQKVLQTVGGLDGLWIHRGYGEEVDLCYRAREAGFVNKVAPDVFVGHLGGRSFGQTKRALALQNNAGLYLRYPGYRKEYDRFLYNDPLHKLRETVSKHALIPIGSPLYLVDAREVEQPVCADLLEKSRTNDAPLSYITVKKNGSRLDVAIHVKKGLHLAPIALELPREETTFFELIKKMAPTKIIRIGEAEGGKELAKRLEKGGYAPVAFVNTTSFSNHRSPRIERFGVNCRMRAVKRMKKNIHPACEIPDRKGSLSSPCERVTTHTKPVPVHLWDEDVFSGDCFMVCGLGTPGAWRHFCDVAHTNASKNVLWLVHDLYAWSPSQAPSGAIPLPLEMDEEPEKWSALAIKKVLFFGHSPHDAQIWKKWAEAKRLGFAQPLCKARVA